jgi:hypothetical protein
MLEASAVVATEGHFTLAHGVAVRVVQKKAVQKSEKKQ